MIFVAIMLVCLLSATLGACIVLVVFEEASVWVSPNVEVTIVIAACVSLLVLTLGWLAGNVL